MFRAGMITLPDSACVHTYKYGDFCAIPVTQTCHTSRAHEFRFHSSQFLGREVAEWEVSRAIFRTKVFFESLSLYKANLRRADLLSKESHNISG